MLVLTRREGESVVISGGIRVTVVKMRKGRVVLGFDAPDDVRIHREEYLVQQEKVEKPERKGPFQEFIRSRFMGEK